MAEPPRLGSGALLLGLLLAGVCLLLARATLTPPKPRPASAAASVFSEERARATLRRVLETGRPHPVGSEANEAVRRRVEQELLALGLAPKLEQAVACGGRGTCARVQNILTRIEGSEPGPAVLLAAHYDSVGAGPGAADDGSGVAAVLEVARALVRGEKPKSPVLLLIDDGEESGLLGARAFVESSAVKDVGAVVNLEARGTRGPSLLFETTGEDAWLMGVIGPRLAHPVTSSLFYSVYRRMPNDTDLSVFRRRGLAGVGFAFIGGVTQYHTPLDDIEHLSAPSLQHQGDNALAAVRALSAARELSSPPQGEAVYFDLLGRTVVSWSLLWARVLGGMALALAVVAVLLLRRRAAISLRRVAASSLRLLGGFAVALLLGTLAQRGWHAVGALPAPFVAHPTPFSVACAAAATLSVAIVARLGRQGLEEWLGALFSWLLLALVLAVVMPKASFVFLVPALSGALAACIGFAREERAAAPALAVLVFAVSAFVLWFPVAFLLEDAVGFAVPGVTALVWALSLSPLAPLLMVTGKRTRTRLVVLAAAAFLAAVFVAGAMKPFSAEAPQRMSIALHVEGERSRFLVDASGGPVSEALAERLELGKELVDPSPWFGGWGPEVRAAAGPRVSLTPPDAELVASAPKGAERRIRLRLRSARGARLLSVEWPASASVKNVTIAGSVVEPWPTRSGYRVSYAGPTRTDGVILELTTGPAPLRLRIADHTLGFPRGVAAPLRPVSAQPSQLGDVTVVSRPITF